MSKNPHLDRSLNWLDATCLVVGTVIGTGIFLKTSSMALLVGSGSAVIWAWFVAGLLSLAGALSYAELGGRFQQAGGEYVYLREAYGKLPAFLFGWMRFWIASPGSIAAYAVGAATFFGGITSLAFIPGGKTGFAIGCIILFSGMNCLTVAFGGKIQTFLTGLKIFMILALVFGIFIVNPGQGHLLENLSQPSTHPSGGFSAFGLALIAALWAFDGWNNLPMVAGEVQRPKRNIPLALGLGMAIVIALYAITNLAYFHALSFDEILGAHNSEHLSAAPVATLAATRFLGENGLVLMSLAMVISALGAMNGSILTGSRVPYAMAHDGVFFSFLGRVSSQRHVPAFSVLAQGAWACVLAASGTFDELTDQVVFASWIFYVATTCSLFIFRKRDKKDGKSTPKSEDLTYRTLGYPFLPILFIGISTILLVNTMVSIPIESLKGLFLIGLGVPAYFWLQKSRKESTPS